MKIEKIKLQNFRGYKSETIELKDLNLFIGKNDAGKSTVLEALDIFFNDKDANKKIDTGDKHFGTSEDIVISVCFSDISGEIVIDVTNPTVLKDEYLLNSEGNLEVVKRYKGKGLKTEVFIRAVHPTADLVKDLLQKKREDLQKIVEDQKIDCGSINKTKKAELRKAIRENCEDLELQEVEVPADKEDAQKIAAQIEADFPLYSLFNSDRENSDSDAEVQDPITLAINEIIGDENLQLRLNEIAEEIKAGARKITTETLGKLKEMNPQIAESLEIDIPKISNSKWSGVFKGVKISSDDGVPLNKRGSGIKRLILLNFFRAQAERRLKKESKAKVIYAIEEPETSQHYDYQKILMGSLKKLSKGGVQVILTSHSPDIVKELFGKEKLSIDETYKMVHIEKEGKQIKVTDINERRLNYFSANEINHVVFGIYTPEHHNELYGVIEEKNLMGKFEKGQPRRPYKKGNADKSYTLTRYIRHQIHHPENKKNKPYTEDELKESIKLMRKHLSGN